MKTSRRIGMGSFAARAIAALMAPIEISMQAQRVNEHRIGPGRVTLYTHWRGIERSNQRGWAQDGGDYRRVVAASRKAPKMELARFVVRQAKRRKRLAMRVEAHLPFTAEGQAVLRDTNPQPGFNRRMEARLEKRERKLACRSAARAALAGVRVGLQHP